MPKIPYRREKEWSGSKQHKSEAMRNMPTMFLICIFLHTKQMIWISKILVLVLWNEISFSLFQSLSLSLSFSHSLCFASLFLALFSTSMSVFVDAIYVYFEYSFPSLSLSVPGANSAAEIAQIRRYLPKIEKPLRENLFSYMFACTLL